MIDKSFNMSNFLKENYKIIIPICLMLVLFISFMVYFKLTMDSNYKIETKEKVYQYFNDKKYEYTSIISKDRKEVIIDVKPQDINLSLDSTPVYYKNENIVVFPKDMSVVMPTLNCAEYLSKGYSYITYENGIYNLTTNKYNKRLNHYFLYDGNDLYFFIEPVTLTIDGEEIKLSPLSYLIAKYNKYISYYDKKTDTYKTIDITDENSTIKNEYYTVYINKDTLAYHGGNYLLTSGIENLITIDNKD